MKSLSRIVVLLVGNITGLLLAAHFIPGFVLSTEPDNVVRVALIFAFLNFTVKPFLKLLLMPIILLTLGLSFFLVNAAILVLLDILTQNLTILGILPLLLASLLVSGTNVIFHMGTKS